MKHITLTLILLLPLIPNYSVNRRELSSAPQNTQVTDQDLLNLEAQFKQIDEEPGSVKVNVTGDRETSGEIKISIERKIFSAARGGAQSTRDDISEPVIEKETVLNIDLSNVNVTDEYVNEKIAAAFSATRREGACPGVKVMKIEGSRDYTVLEDYTYNSGAYSITAWKDFIYDRASVPRIVWVLISQEDLSNVAPLFHDLLYRNGGVLPENRVSPYRKFSREDTDKLFRELMAKCGVKPWRREAAYQAVRKFAGPAWKGQ